MLGIDYSLRQIMISRDSHRNGHRKRRTIQPFGSRPHRCCGWSSGASKTILVHLHRLGGCRPWLEQTGSDGKTKIRRGEDWRRSGHNATCIMHDQPFHHPYWHASNTTTTDHSKFGDMATEEPIDNYHYTILDKRTYSSWLSGVLAYVFALLRLSGMCPPYYAVKP